MRKVLAITVALIIAAIVLTPALGYTIQSAGNKAYTATSGAKVSYSMNAGVPAHNLTPEMMMNKYTFKAPAVTGTKVPYSIKQGSAMPYSIKLIGVNAAKNVEAKPEEGIVATKANETAATATPAPVEQPMFTIEGIVFDDADGSGVMDNNETGLGNWTVNLEQPAGTVIKSATTTMDGKFMFADLAAGEYTVSEVVQMDWQPTAPAEGNFTETITDASATGLAFGNQLIPAAPETPAVSTNATIV